MGSLIPTWPVKMRITAIGSCHNTWMRKAYSLRDTSIPLFLLEDRSQRGGRGDLKAPEDPEGEATAGLGEAR